jgi:hypothetical protein
MRRTAALLAMLALGLSACSAITGRPFIEWSEDKAITARVKARLTAERFRASRPVDHVTVHAMPGDSSVPTAHYLLVLWHVPELTPAR